tara:strand:+ start:4014 stop:7046 length:3033 start_codon:yes stop_codon:yes gene_type:complete
MASVNKIELCGTTATKLARDGDDPNDLECEAISLPHGIRDVLFVSDCFVGADVKARLEHSPDGSAGSWATVQTKQISGGEAATSWGNEKYLDTAPKRPSSGTDPDYKNKHLKLTTNFSGVDIIQHKLDATSPFNLSLWMKSGEVPATTYVPAQNEVYLDTNQTGSHVLTMPGTAVGADRIVGTDKSWTISWWEKYSTTYYKGANHYGLTTMNAAIAPSAGKHGFYCSGVWASSAPKFYFIEDSTTILSASYAARNGTNSRAGVVQFSAAYDGSPNTGTTAKYTGDGGTLNAVAAGNRDQDEKTIVDPTDGEWHHIVLTFKAAADPAVDNWAALSPEVAEGAAGLRYYVDGYECYQQSHSSVTAALDGSVPYVMDDFEYDIHHGYYWDGTYGTTQALGTTLDKRYILQEAFHSEYMTQENVDKLYGASTPGALDGKPQQEYDLSLTGFVTNPCVGFFDFEELGAGHANIGDGTTGHTLNSIGNPSDTDSSNSDYGIQYDFNNKGSNANIKYRYYSAQNWNRIDANLIKIADNSGDSATFIAENANTTYGPILFRSGGKTGTAPNEDFGEGITVSLTDKVKTDGTWNIQGNELPHLLISFNGFENDADQWVAYKCNQGSAVQRNVSYSGATPTTENVNLLDDSWHNIILNYKGVASDGDTAYLGPDADPTVGGHANEGYEFHVSMDGQLTDTININKGFDAAKTVDAYGIATLAIHDKHLKNVSDTYVPTTFFASGFLEAAATDSRYAFQGYIDETSFHSDSWWKDTGNPHKMCDCPIESIWGDNAQRLTGGQAGSPAAYGFTPMDNAPSVPHDLMDPQSIMTKPGDWAYIEPFPSGMYRCDENMPGHTSKALCDADTLVGKQAHSDGATGHWTANGGGLEVYYRWGDVPTDCQNCVNEARGYTTGISDDEAYTNVEDTLKRSANIEGSLDWRDLKLSVTTAEKIYVEGSSGGGGAGSVTYIDAINNCSATGNHVITYLNAPHLHYVRVVYVGDGACTAGQCIASLFYRKEK